METKIAVISDIHGNLEALKVVLKNISRTRFDEIICLGDVVGYGPDSTKCMNLLLEIPNISFILGNHESMLLDETTDEKCSELGKISSKWTKENVDENTKNIIKSKFHKSIQRGPFLFVHSSYPYDTNWKYAYTPDSYKENFKISNEIKYIFLGHTHRAQIFSVSNDYFSRMDNGMKAPGTYEYILNEQDTHYINVGSVGQARDSNSLACYVEITYSNKRLKVKFFKLRYNVWLTYSKIRASGLGEKIAGFLIQEKWRRKRYEYTYNWRERLFRQLFKR